MTNYKDSILNKDCTLLQALEIIEKSETKLLVVVDNSNRLIGTITDGDIRRTLISGESLTQSVNKAMNRNPVYMAHDANDEEILTLMSDLTIRHMPIVDNEQRIVDIKLLQDLIKTPKHDNWIIIFAGGLGTRLRPLTNDTPKPMLEVGGRPILESSITRFASAGYRKIFLSVNYHADSIKAYFGDGKRFQVSIEYLEEDNKLGTAGALSLLPSIPNHPILVMNGDILTNLNIEKMFEFHEKKKSIATMGVREYETQIPYGVISIEDGKIISMKEKPYQQYYINAGLYVLSPKVLTLIPENEEYDMPSLFQSVMDMGHVSCAYPIHEYWLDVGHVGDYVKANMDYKEI